MTSTAAHAGLVAALSLVAGLLVATPAVAETQGAVGATSVASPATAPALAASRTASSARPTSMVVKGRTKKKRAVVRIKGWKTARRKWVLLKKIRSKRHRFQTRVSLKGVGKRKLKVKRRGQKTIKVRIPRIASPPPPRGPSAPPGEPCGGPVAKADGTMWICSFSDEFEGTELDRTKWRPQTGHFENSVCYRDTPETIAVEDGALHLRLVKGAAEPCDDRRAQVSSYVAGSVSTYRLFSQKFGRFEARTRNTDTDAPGLQEAFWLWPDDRFVDVTRWPASGEIDIAETYSRHPDLAIPFLHTALDLEAYTQLLTQALKIPLLYNILLGGQIPWNLVQSAISNTAWNCQASRGEWNTYLLEWGPQKIEIFVNGKLCLRNTSGDPAFRQPYIVAFTQLLGVGDNAPTPQTPLPATYQVDYVRVWK